MAKTSNSETMMHLLKGNIGTGILALPNSFAHAGIWIGTIATPLMGVIAIHCMHLLIKCQQKLCVRFQSTFLDYDEVAEKAILIGPEYLQERSTLAKKTVTAFLLITQLGFCCVYALFVAVNVREFLCSISNDELNISIYLVLLVELPLMVLLNFIGELKHLAIASSIANCLQIGGIVIVFYNLLQDLPPTWSRPAAVSIAKWPLFFGTVIYAFEGIGIVLPLQKEMKEPKAFPGSIGVLNTGMIVVSCLYVAMGFYGYLKYGETAAASITLNLPPTFIYHSVRLAFALAIFFSYPIQLYVPMQILWPVFRDSFLLNDKHPNLKFFNYGFRAFIVFMTFVIAALIPKLDLFISLVGALSSSCLALIFPPIIHIATYWEERNFASNKYRLSFGKDIFIMIFGIIGFLTGTYASIVEIIIAFSK